MIISYTYSQQGVSKKNALKKSIEEKSVAYDDVPDGRKKRKLLNKLSDEIDRYILLANTSDEMYWCYNMSHDDRQMKACEKNINQLILVELYLVHTTEALIKLYNKAFLEEDTFLKNQIVTKWNSFLLKELPLLETSDSMFSWYQNNIDYFEISDEDLSFDTKIYNKWISLLEKEPSPSFSSVDFLLQNSFVSTADRIFLIEKQLNVMSTESQSQRTYKHICRTLSFDFTPDEGKKLINQKQRAYNIWKKYYPNIEEVKKTLEENANDSKMAGIWLLAVEDEFGDDFYGPIKTSLLMLRWIELTDSYEELMTIWKKTDPDSDVEKAVLQKLATFVHKK
jgi:hypothetical protein